MQMTSFTKYLTFCFQPAHKTRTEGYILLQTFSYLTLTLLFATATTCCFVGSYTFLDGENKAMRTNKADPFVTSQVADKSKADRGEEVHFSCSQRSWRHVTVAKEWRSEICLTVEIR